MSRVELEQLFERFRRDGDPDALGEVFDAAAGDLLRIARRLTSGRSEAEDLVQATCLAAIERAASFDQERALKPWLIGILVRQAALSRRRAGRAKELVDEPSSRAPEPSDVLANREFAESLAHALDRLTPAEREVLVPLLVDGKRAVQVARELEKRPEAIHMRLHRGLAKLRRLLPAGFGLGFAVILLRRVALAHVRREVLKAARTSIPGQAIPGTAGTFAAGSVVVAAIVIAGAGVVLWNVRSRSTRADVQVVFPTGSVRETIGSGSVVQASSNGVRGSLTPASPDSVRTSAAVTPTRWIVRGHLNGLQNGESLTSTLAIDPLAPAMAFGWADPQSIATVGAIGHTATPPAITATIPADGVFEVDVSALFTADPAHPPREIGLTIDHPRYLVAKSKVLVEKGVLVQDVDGQPVLEFTCDVDVRLAAVVHGCVFAPLGSSADHCELSIHLMIGDTPNCSSEDKTTCAPGGEFRLRAASSGNYIVLASTPDSMPATCTVQTSIGEDLALSTINLDAGSHLSGSVTAGGVAQPHMKVEAWSTSPPPDPGRIAGGVFQWTPQGFVRFSGAATTDDQGLFTIGGLPTGEFGIAARGCAPPADLLAFPTRSLPAVISTAPAENLSIPVSASEIEFQIDGVDSVPAEIVTEVADDGDGVAITTSSPWSSIQRIGFAPNREVSVTFRLDGYEPYSTSITTPGPGESLAEHVSFIPLSTATLHVHLTADDGAVIPEAGFGFFLQPTAGEPVPSSPSFMQAADAEGGTDGEFTLSAIPPGNYEVRVHVDGTYDRYNGYYRESGFLVELSPGAEETRTLALSPGGRIRATLVSSSNASAFTARLLDGAGAECPIQFCRSAASSIGSGTWTSSPTYVGPGANDTYPNLAPGLYRLQVNRDPRPLIDLPVQVIVGATSEITVDIDAP
jgi:RNA polymerase sigma-70 factor (ECF subfamily)